MDSPKPHKDTSSADEEDPLSLPQELVQNSHCTLQPDPVLLSVSWVEKSWHLFFSQQVFFFFFFEKSSNNLCNKMFKLWREIFSETERARTRVRARMHVHTSMGGHSHKKWSSVYFIISGSVGLNIKIMICLVWFRKKHSRSICNIHTIWIQIPHTNPCQKAISVRSQSAKQYLSLYGNILNYRTGIFLLEFSFLHCEFAGQNNFFYGSNGALSTVSNESKHAANCAVRMFPATDARKILCHLQLSTELFQGRSSQTFSYCASPSRFTSCLYTPTLLSYILYFNPLNDNYYYTEN